MPNNLFLTGPIKVGKSTIINKFLADFNGVVAGFRTEAKIDESGNRLFVIKSILPDKTLIAPICELGPDKRLQGKKEAFNIRGVQILQESMQAAPSLIIMDELGLFETEAFKFQFCVEELLTTSIPVIGVLKYKSSRFLDRIRMREDVIEWTVTQENRNCLIQEVKEWVGG